MSSKQEDVDECQAPLAICSYAPVHPIFDDSLACVLHKKFSNHRIDENSHKPCIAVDPRPCKPCGKILGTSVRREW